MKIIFLSALILVSCRTKPDPLFCDLETSCSDDSRPFCDLNGEFSESDGVKNTCIADPNGVRDAGVPSDAGPVQDCVSSPECAETSPICSSGGTCQVCQVVVDDLECEGRDPNTPFCAPTGLCGGCRDNVDCPQSDANICDVDSYTCRGCQENDECDSGACDKSSGTCVGRAAVIYINFDSGVNSASCGETEDAPCRRFAGQNGVLNRLRSGRSTVVMAATTHTEALNLSGVSLTLVGDGAILQPPPGNAGAVVRIDSGSAVVIDGLTLRGGTGDFSGNGIAIENSSAELVNVTASENASNGILSSNSRVRLEDTTISGNRGEGIKGEGSQIEISRSTVADNAIRGVLLYDSALDLRQSSIRANRNGGVHLFQTAFHIENNFIVQNGDLNGSSSNPVGGINVYSDRARTPQEILFNTIADNRSPAAARSPGVYCDTTSESRMDSNIIYTNRSNSTDAQFAGACALSYSLVEGGAEGPGNLEGDPSFVSDSDYHLQLNSPGVNQANPDGATTVDIDGDSRPIQAVSDIGADEVS